MKYVVSDSRRTLNCSLARRVVGVSPTPSSSATLQLSANGRCNGTNSLRMLKQHWHYAFIYREWSRNYSSRIQTCHLVTQGLITQVWILREWPLKKRSCRNLPRSRRRMHLCRSGLGWRWISDLKWIEMNSVVKHRSRRYVVNPTHSTSAGCRGGNLRPFSI